jgi:hypothetical protein
MTGSSNIELTIDIQCREAFMMPLLPAGRRSVLGQIASEL